jgi:predicted nuclease with TOPRIM domain
MNTSQSLIIDSFGFDDLDDVYKILSNEYSQLSYRYKQICKNFKDVEQEKESLMTKLSKSHALIDSLKPKISMLVENNISRENDLKDSKELSEKSLRDNLKRFFYVDNKHNSMIVENVGNCNAPKINLG